MVRTPRMRCARVFLTFGRIILKDLQPNLKITLKQNLLGTSVENNKTRAAN